MVINNMIFNCDLWDVLVELKNQLDINHIPLLSVIKDDGKNVMVSCPYHKDGQERRPSAGIRKTDGVFHCFACGEVHDLHEVISHCFGHYEDTMGSFGWKWLNRNFATVAVEERKDVEIDIRRSISPDKNSVLGNSDNNKPTWVSESELDKYRHYHPYWAKRGITDERIIELFDLGYDKETDCITMPVRDKSGHTLFVARRSVKRKFFNYPEGVEKPLYGLFEIYTAACKVGTEYEYGRKIKDYYSQVLFPQEIIICESMIDCILLWQSGHYAVALNGTGSELQYKQLNELPCRHFIIATDNDKAGNQARHKLRSKIKNKLITNIMFPLIIKDVGECTREEIDNIRNWEVF